MCPEDSLLSADQCKFAHHWIPDTTDILDEESLNLENAFQVLLREDGPILLVALIAISMLFVVFVKITIFVFKSKPKIKTS